MEEEGNLDTVSGLKASMSRSKTPSTLTRSQVKILCKTLKSAYIAISYFFQGLECAGIFLKNSAKRTIEAEIC